MRQSDLLACPQLYKRRSGAAAFHGMELRARKFKV
jgi:hypothetical protein